MGTTPFLFSVECNIRYESGFFLPILKKMEKDFSENLNYSPFAGKSGVFPEYFKVGVFGPGRDHPFGMTHPKESIRKQPKEGFIL